MPIIEIAVRGDRSAPMPAGRLLIVVVLGILGGCVAFADSPAPRPNIVFITIDALRADRLGCYGHGGSLSPTLDTIAREGVLFERAISTSPWTLPSVASTFCGYYPTVHKVTSYEEALELWGRSWSVDYFGEEFTTLAEVLREHGYHTAGFSANPFVTTKYGFAQGFDHFDATFASNSTRGDVVSAAALGWLQTAASRPFFLYLHYMDVHAPYTDNLGFVDPLIAAVEASPERRELTQEEATRHRSLFEKSARAFQDSPQHRRLSKYAEYWQARYEAGVRQMDYHLRQLRSVLLDQGLWQDALVVVTADHGESLGEHHLWAHGLSAHQDQLHVPLLLRWSGHLPEGRRIEKTVSLFDVMPTILELLRIEPQVGIQARSLGDLIADQDQASRPALAEAVKTRPGEKALILDHFKLIADSNRHTFELYDLAEDPTEQQDLAGRQLEGVARLRLLLERQVEENQVLSKGFEKSAVGVSREELEHLRALGYVDGGEKDGTSVPKQRFEDRQ